ncbi:RNA polymerase sigma factor [Rubripirellula obstinata]|uniref:RNA polymerase sigma factor n=1 Tax=Rubripirellula obstinata TaxID=406547 RepID=UPI00135B827F|nr:sigma-70 family RNA polymerase sigma factor [Rubripirellula obstinata]
MTDCFWRQFAVACADNTLTSKMFQEAEAKVQAMVRGDDVIACETAWDKVVDLAVSGVMLSHDNPTALVKTSVRNVLRDLGRKMKVRPAQVDIEVLHDVADRTVESYECSQRVDNAIEKLPDDQRDVVERKRDNQSGKEIAAELGISAARVSQRSRAAEKSLILTLAT